MRFTDCGICATYPHIRAKATRVGCHPVYVFADYMTGVHDRHLAGLSLAVVDTHG